MIRLNGIGKQFDGRWIFRDISLSVPAQGSIALVGPSGCGKSVLLRIISGLMAPDSGSVQLGSENLGMLFQKNALFDSLTVEENLLFPMKERLGLVGAAARTRSAALLESVGLSGNQRLFPSSLSGGMQKRLGIARALCVEPEVILYDEPTAGLDPITSKKIAELIRDLQSKNGNTLITVTNDMQRAYQLGDRVFVLAQGQLMGGGSPEETQKTQDPLIRQFIYGLKQGPLTSEFA